MHRNTSPRTDSNRRVWAGNSQVSPPLLFPHSRRNPLHRSHSPCCVAGSTGNSCVLCIPLFSLCARFLCSNRTSNSTADPSSCALFCTSDTNPTNCGHSHDRSGIWNRSAQGFAPPSHPFPLLLHRLYALLRISLFVHWVATLSLSLAQSERTNASLASRPPAAEIGLTFELTD